MALARHIPAANASIKAGKWEKSRFLGRRGAQQDTGCHWTGQSWYGRSPSGTGPGDADYCLRSICLAGTGAQIDVTMMSLDEVLAQADFVTLHTSLTSGPNGTRGLIGARELGLMKPTARLINCARGGLIDEEALLTGTQ